MTKMTVDTVAKTRFIRDTQYEQLKGKSIAERITFYRKKAVTVHPQRSLEHTGNDLTWRESSAQHNNVADLLRRADCAEVNALYGSQAADVARWAELKAMPQIRVAKPEDASVLFGLVQKLATSFFVGKSSFRQSQISFSQIQTLNRPLPKPPDRKVFSVCRHGSLDDRSSISQIAGITVLI